MGVWMSVWMCAYGEMDAACVAAWVDGKVGECASGWE